MNLNAEQRDHIEPIRVLLQPIGHITLSDPELLRVWAADSKRKLALRIEELHRIPVGNPVLEASIAAETLHTRWLTSTQLTLIAARRMAAGL